MVGRIDSSRESSASSARHSAEGPARGSARNSAIIAADIHPHRSPEFAALMFEALDTAFAALGHPDPVEHLRRQAESRPAGSATADRRVLVVDFATDILLTAARYATRLEARQQAGSPARRGGIAA